MAWSNKMDAQLRPNEYVETVKRLLEINLVACFRMLFWLSDFERRTCAWRFDNMSPSISPKKSLDRGFLGWLNYLPKESDPLAQQAVIHVLSSIESMARDGYRFSTHLFRDWPRCYLLELYVRSRSLNRQKSDEVAQAMNTLQATLESMSFHQTQPLKGWSSSIRPILILDYIRENDA